MCVCFFIYIYIYIFCCCYLFIYLFLAVLGLHFCARTFSSCGKRGPLFIAVRRPFTIAASLVAGHRLQARRLSSCGSRAQLLRGMWDLPGSGREPVSPALAGRLSTTAPPGKPGMCFKVLEHIGWEPSMWSHTGLWFLQSWFSPLDIVWTCISQSLKNINFHKENNNFHLCFWPLQQSSLSIE